MSLKKMLVAVMGGAVLFLGPATHSAENVPQGHAAQQDKKQRADRVIEGAQKQMPRLGDLVKEIRGPDDHDRATAALGMDATLANFHLATEVTTPIGPAIHIPVQISKREGGRKSLYFIRTGEQVIAGVYVVDSRLYYRAVRRDSGKAVPAEDGDLFTELILDPQGTVVFEGQGRLQILDFDRGIGALEPVSGGGSLAEMEKTSIWVLWSCVKVEE